MTPPRLVLASQSPRRRQLLDLIGVSHEVRPADIDETLRPDESPPAYAERLAREKASRIAAATPGAVIVAADTIVVLDGDVLGKPVDATEAVEMLRRLSGRTHTVHTAVAVARGAAMHAGIESVEVTFRPLEAAVIDAYVATGEPMDKAGAYGIQGFGATIVERIHGDYFAVMGLPLGRMVELLRRVGVEYRFGALVAVDAPAG
jgi:nucleoside triphosphate pyrophosphatase